MDLEKLRNDLSKLHANREQKVIYVKGWLGEHGNGHAPEEAFRLIDEIVPPEPASGQFLPELKYLDGIEEQEVKFLWNPYIPIGKLTLLEGDPEVGKSWVTLAFATAISLGHGLPPDFGANYIGYTLVASAEDGLADTIKPRLTSMGANSENICALDDKGFALLEDYIKQAKPILVIIDPLVAYLSSEMDINKANQVRFATARLARLAETYNFGNGSG